MKTTRKFTTIAMTFFLGLAIFASCQKEESNNPVSGDEKNAATTTTNTTSYGCNCLVNASPTVTEEETSMLVFMMEEEKLARDVYKAMYDLYHIPIFRNIKKSEQHHMNQVLALLQYYNIPDPSSPDTGVFNNPDLQQLYDDLTAQGNISMTEALKVGATIEDKDIFDLETDMTNTANPAILCTFDKLACASTHHIRSFSALLTARGVTYVPQYISQEEYNSIITQPAQNCAQ
jgi:hypothetical protein